MYVRLEVASNCYSKVRVYISIYLSIFLSNYNYCLFQKAWIGGGGGEEGGGGLGLPGPGLTGWMSLMADQLGQDQMRPPFFWPAAFHNKLGHINPGSIYVVLGLDMHEFGLLYKKNNAKKVFSPF